jgi:hypothetical protein
VRVGGARFLRDGLGGPLPVSCLRRACASKGRVGLLEPDGSCVTCDVCVRFAEFRPEGMVSGAGEGGLLDWDRAMACYGEAGRRV